MSRRGALAALAISLGTFLALLARVLADSGPLAIDAAVLERVGTGASAFWALVTRIGDPIPLVVLVCLALVALRRQREDMLVFAGATAVGGLLDGACKLLILRGRPDSSELLGATQSFPSGHTLMTTVVFGALALILWRRLERRRPYALLLTAVPVLVGASRIMLGRHWLSDVVAGLALGVAIVAAAELARAAVLERGEAKDT